MPGRWWRGLVLAALVGCSSGSQKNGAGGTGGPSSTGAGGGSSGVGRAPSAATDTNPANPNVTNMPPSSPNGPTVTVQPGSGGVTGAGTGGSPAKGTGGVTGTATGGRSGGATGGQSGGATGGVTGAGGGVSGSGGTVVDAGAPVDAGSSHDAAVTGANGGIPASWPTVDCVGGPCGPPGVCVNLDFLYVACSHCGNNDEVCCPPYAASDPFLGTCGAGMICAQNPNFHQNPPLDLVEKVCQVPGSPPPSDGGLNHERLRMGN